MRIYKINSDNYNSYKNILNNILKQPNMCGIFSESCNHCQEMKPAWDELKTKIGKTTGVGSLIEIDSPVLSEINNVHLNKSIKGYPTILIMKNGFPKKEYKGNRTANDMFKYFKKNIEPSSSSPLYKSPYKMYRMYGGYKMRRSKKKYSKSKFFQKNRNTICICNKQCSSKCKSYTKKVQTLRKNKKSHKYKH